MIVSAINSVQNKKYKQKQLATKTSQYQTINFAAIGGGHVSAPKQQKVAAFITKQANKLQKIGLKLLGANEALLKSYKHEDDFINCLKTAYKIGKKADTYSLDKSLFSSKMQEIISSKSYAEAGETPHFVIQDGEYFYGLHDLGNIYEVSRVHKEGGFLQSIDK